MDFKYWNDLQQPERFLEGDWENPSRQWATQQITTIACQPRTIVPWVVEVGPGNGIDYERYLRPLVQQPCRLMYTGYEGSATLCASLRSRYPEAEWINAPLLALPPKSFDIVYARHVLEHQPALEPNLSHLLGAAREAVVLVWYRPPAQIASHEVGAAGEHYHTYLHTDVLDVIDRAGWQIIEKAILPGDGNHGWVLKRKAG